MKDLEIRQNFHRKILWRHHASRKTLVLDELGLMHGACRADIAVINGKLVGYEIKSEKDSLLRLKNQIVAYDSIFDNIAIIVCERHQHKVTQSVPKHWGIVLSTKGKRGAIHFTTKRTPKDNPHINPIAIAQLLWKKEAIALLIEIGCPSNLLNSPRAKLYCYLSDHLPLSKLRHAVRTCLKKRSNWRCRPRPFLYDGLSQPSAK